MKKHFSKCKDFNKTQEKKKKKIPFNFICKSPFDKEYRSGHPYNKSIDSFRFYANRLLLELLDDTLVHGEQGTSETPKV